MNKTLLLPALLCAATVFAADEPAVVDGLVASVNGKPIAISDVMRQMPPYLEAARESLGRTADDRAVFRTAFTNALAELENKELILQKYREGESRIPETAVSRMASETLEKRFHGNYAELQAELAKNGMTYEDWTRRIEERLIVGSMRSAFTDGGTWVSPSEVTAAYKARKHSFAQPATMRLSLISIPLSETNAIRACRTALRGGMSFAEAAKAYSVDPHAFAGGDYGVVAPAEEFAPTLAARMLKEKDGVVVGPVAYGKNAYWFVRSESTPASVPSLQDVWEDLERTLLEERYEARFRKWIEDLRKNADIRERLPAF